MRTVCHTLEETEKEAVRFAKALPTRNDGATLITFSGELGAGKTTFIKVVAATLGVVGGVTSPTFVLEKIYALPDGGTFSKLVHIDAYRLENGTALAALGFDEIMQDTQTLILLEWPERVVDMLPPQATHVTLEILPDKSREIIYDR